VLAVSTVEFTLGGLTLVLALIIAAVFLARHDRITRVKFGIFLERERYRDDDELPPSEGDTKIMGPWPGQKKEEE
jgi:hypothetical protein